MVHCVCSAVPTWQHFLVVVYSILGQHYNWRQIKSPHSIFCLVRTNVDDFLLPIADYVSDICFNHLFKIDTSSIFTFL